MLGTELGGPFDLGRNGPGGWMILYEPELHLQHQVVVPDWAAWRKERLPELPRAPFITLAPDWVCEILRPGTEKTDRDEKMPIYAEFGISYLWLVEPICRRLEAYRLVEHTYQLAGQFKGFEVIRAVPFDAIELELGMLWI